MSELVEPKNQEADYNVCALCKYFRVSLSNSAIQCIKKKREVKTEDSCNKFKRIPISGL